MKASGCSQILLAATLLIGCASPKTDTITAVTGLLNKPQNIIRAEEKSEDRTERIKARNAAVKEVWEELLKVGGASSLSPSAHSANGVRAAASQGELYAALRESSLITKLIDANVQAVLSVRSQLNGEIPMPVKPIEFNRHDFMQFVEETVPKVGIASWRKNATNQSEALGMAGASKSEGRLKQYLIVYFQGDFVDHAGRKVPKPEMKEGNIGNETIVGLATVILESLYDSLYSVPAYFQKDASKLIWLNKNKIMPTFVALNVDAGGNPDSKTAINIATQSAIDETELRAITFLSDLASEESKAISGMVFRLLGGGELSFVIGGHLSIGNNETLSTLVDTILSVSTYRTTEALTYAYFKVHAQGDYGNLEELIKLIKFVRNQIDNAKKKEQQ